MEMIMRVLFATCSLFLLSGCSSMEVRMMPRDSGNVYVGKVATHINKTATIDITIDDEQYSGLAVQATTNDSFGLIQKYGPHGPSFGVVTTGGGTRINKALLSSPNGRGLRCEATATGMGGAGICVDDKGRVFDALIHY